MPKEENKLAEIEKLKKKLRKKNDTINRQIKAIQMLTRELSEEDKTEMPKEKTLIEESVKEEETLAEDFAELLQRAGTVNLPRVGMYNIEKEVRTVIEIKVRNAARNALEFARAWFKEDMHPGEFNVVLRDRMLRRFDYDSGLEKIPDEADIKKYIERKKQEARV